MNIPEKVTYIRNELVKQRPNAAIDNSLDWGTFVISLIPGCQPAQIANKILNDNKLKAEFEKLWDNLKAVNTRLTTIEGELIQRIELIQATIANNSKLQSELEEFLEQLKSSLKAEPTEFSVETLNFSTQEIINTLIYADWVKVSSHSNSSNIFSKLKIQEAKKMDLIAKDDSHNVIQDLCFNSKKSSVSMDGKHIQKGEVTLSEAYIDYKPNSQTQMDLWSMTTDAQGRSFSLSYASSELTVQCSFCKGNFQVSSQELDGLRFVQCKLCGRVNSI